MASVRSYEAPGGKEYLDLAVDFERERGTKSWDSDARRIFLRRCGGLSVFHRRQGSQRCHPLVVA